MSTRISHAAIRIRANTQPDVFGTTRSADVRWITDSDAVDRGGSRCVNANFDGRTISFDAGASLLSFLVVSSGQLDLGDQCWSGSKDQRYLTWRRSSSRAAPIPPNSLQAILFNDSLRYVLAAVENAKWSP